MTTRSRSRSPWLVVPTLALLGGCGTLVGLSNLEEVDCVTNCGGAGAGGSTGDAGSAGAAGTSAVAGSAGAAGAGKAGASGAAGKAGNGGASGVGGAAGAAGGGAGGAAGAAGAAGVGGAGGGKAGSAGVGGASGKAGAAGASGGGAGGKAGNGGAGGAPCTPKACAALGATCGTIDDGCGTTLDCGASNCTPPLGCGAANVPNVCGCKPGSYTCVGDQLKRCSNDGSTFSVAANCPGGSCSAMGMTGTCNACAGAGTLICQGAALNKCVPDGMGGFNFPNVKTCSSPDLCDAAKGDCDATCIPNSFVCVGATLKKCTDGTLETAVAQCATPELCAASVFTGTCKPPVCNVGDTSCSGAVPVVCNAGRTGFDMKPACMSAALCNAKTGSCTPPACGPADNTCVGNTLKQCKADFTGFDMTACKAPTPACDPTAKACVDRGPPLVGVAGFFTDATEVTNAQYNQFLFTNPPVGVPAALCAWNATYGANTTMPSLDNLPVIGVDWCDAYNYCQWAGKRLCGKIGGGPVAFTDTADDTKDQWMVACEGPLKSAYPYSNAYVASTCNDSGMSPASDVVAVGSDAKCQGGYAGLFDMSGNVAEWEDGCSGTSGQSDICPTRGGSFKSASADLACSAKGTFARGQTASFIGFRCCAD